MSTADFLGSINYSASSHSTIESSKEETFQMAARALIRAIRLKKTPRVLSIEGDFDAVIGDWKEVLSGNLIGK